MSPVYNRSPINRVVERICNLHLITDNPGRPGSSQRGITDLWLYRGEKVNEKSGPLVGPNVANSFVKLKIDPLVVRLAGESRGLTERNREREREREEDVTLITAWSLRHSRKRIFRVGFSMLELKGTLPQNANAFGRNFKFPSTSSPLKAGQNPAGRTVARKINSRVKEDPLSSC